MKPQILFLTNLLPFPKDNGGKIKTYNTLMMLKDSYSIDLFCFIEHEEDKEYSRILEKEGIHVVLVEKILRHQKDFYLLLKEIFKSLFSFYPYVVSKYSDNSMQNKTQEAINRHEYECIYVDHLQLFQYVREIRKKKNKVKVILDQHNVESEIIKRRIDQTKNLLKRWFLYFEYYKLRKFETSSCIKADLVLAITDVDYKRIQKLTGGRVNCKVAPFFVEKQDNLYVDSNEKAILFLGTMSWYPNEHAVLWFYENVFCKYGFKSQGWKFLIVGSDPGIKVHALTSDTSVVVTGRVDEVDSYIKAATVAIVPIFVGGGMRIKILELLARGIPIISTSIGSEGIPITDQENILSANTPQEFSIALNNLASDKNLAHKISFGAWQFVNEKYSFESARKEFLQIYKNSC